MDTDLPPDDSDDVLNKVDALLKKHQRGSPKQPPHRAPPPAEEPATMEDFDDIPTLTDIVETAAPAAGNPTPEALLSGLEERLHRELEARLAPQLTQAFQQALAQLLDEAKLQISLTVREHLRQEMLRQNTPSTQEK